MASAAGTIRSPLSLLRVMLSPLFSAPPLHGDKIKKRKQGQGTESLHEETTLPEDRSPGSTQLQQTNKQGGGRKQRPEAAWVPGVGCRLLVRTASECPRQRPVSSSPIEASACCEMLWAAHGASMLAFMGDPYASAPGEPSGLNCA